MKILITGTSGTGKSTIASALRARGLHVIETDYEHYIAYWEHIDTGQREQIPSPIPPDWFAMHHWKWDVDVLREVLTRSAEVTYVCGDARNKAEAFSLFDRLVVLTADDATLTHRLVSRTNNPYGKTADERRWALEANAATVQELENAGATVVDASRPIDQVLEDVLEASEGPAATP